MIVSAVFISEFSFLELIRGVNKLIFLYGKKLVKIFSFLGPFQQIYCLMFCFQMGFL